MVYFEKAGKENTIPTLEIAKQEAIKRGIKYVVVASTTGYTADQAANIFADTDINLVIVTHNTGFAQEGQQQFDQTLREKLEKKGIKILTATMPTRSLGAAIRDKGGYTHEQLIADTLRIFGQGMKVACEIVIMAADAGLIPITDVIAVAGTGSGADTAILVKPNSSNRFFNLKVKEIIAKPLNF